MNNGNNESSLPRCNLCGEESEAMGKTTVAYCTRCQMAVQDSLDEQRTCPNCGMKGTIEESHVRCSSIGCHVRTFYKRHNKVKEKAAEKVGGES